MSSEGPDSTICSDIVFREFVNSYSCDEIVLDVFYNGCFLIYPLKYGGEAFELKLSKPRRGLTIVENDRDVKKMYEMSNLHGLLEVYVSHSPQLLVTDYYLKNLCVDESDDEVTSQLKSYQKIKKDVDSYSLEEMIAWEQKESQSPCYLISPNPLKPKILGIDLKGKFLLNDFESVKGEGLGSSSSNIKITTNKRKDKCQFENGSFHTNIKKRQPKTI
ncbi:hypothetical protein Tco_1259307 [Tanacetum coccineum]